MSLGCRAIRACLGLSIGAAVGCDRPIESAELTGTYVLEGVAASDTINVSSGHRYVHAFRAIDGAVVRDSGEWSFKQLDGTRLVFHQFRQGVLERLDRRVSPVADSNEPANEWVALVERDLSGRLRIVVNADLGWSYVKRNN